MFLSSSLVAVATILALQNAFSASATSPSPLSKKPNFVMIMTDDQDLHLNSLNYQPAVREHFSKKGIFYKKHFVTISQCCPSRVSLWTGMAGHNTNVTDVRPPYGGYPKFIEEGLNERYLPVWLQSAGYNTYYTGKLMNFHNTDNYNKPFINGWNGSDFLIDPGTYIYYNATMQRNHDPPTHFPGNYSTDLIASKAVGFLEEAAKSDAPFFLGVMPIAPHTQVTHDAAGNPIFGAPVPAHRYKDLYHGVKVPRTANFNPKQPGSASYLKHLARQNDTVVAYNDELYRLRLAALASVDDLITTVMNHLEALNLLDNTYIIYTADNGFHIGQHRLDPGKTCAFEEDINVPFFIRGPGVPSGITIDVPTTHTDIVPTIFKLANITLLSTFDGTPMPITQKDLTHAKSEHVNIEFWGSNMGEGDYARPNNGNNTYKALRVVAKDYDIAYMVWCTNEHELYNMKTDPVQMQNIWGSRDSIGNFDIKSLQPRLDALMMVLKSCKGEVCVKPWKALHPQGDVASLAESMQKKYDKFYTAQPKVSFDTCALGYLPEREGPMDALPFNGGHWYGDGIHWSEWT